MKKILIAKQQSLFIILLILFIQFITLNAKVTTADEKPRVPTSKILKYIRLTSSTSVILAISFPTKSLPKTSIITVPTSKLGAIYFVDPMGQDGNNGLSTDTPFQTIQKAIDTAQPNDLIYLSPGHYKQDFITKRDGKENAQITIIGPNDAIVTGGGKPRVAEIKHSYITLKGFTIDGQHGIGSSASDYRDKLIYVLGSEPKSGVKGLKVVGMRIQNAGGECVRLRYFAQNNEIAESTIRNCGVHDFRFNSKGKNGEGVYIGTAPEQLDDGKNPTPDPDQSNNNWIHDNVINTQGNECVDIKEFSEGNLVENNICTGQKDPNSGGMDSRGSKNTFRSNNIFGNIGAGIRLGGDSDGDGTNNNIYDNKISSNLAGGIKFEGSPQGKVCSNKMSGNSGGASVGSFKSQFDPISSCV